MSTASHLRRMARYSRFLARAARAVVAEFQDEYTVILSEKEDVPLDLIIDLRGFVVDNRRDAEGHDRDAEALEKAANDLEPLP